MPKLQNAHVLVTGGSSGIGLATARLAVERGARVSLVARRTDVLDEAAGSIRAAGGKVAVAAADVADGAQVDTRGGEAGRGPDRSTSRCARPVKPDPATSSELDPDLFRPMMDVNYFGDGQRRARSWCRR